MKFTSLYHANLLHPYDCEEPKGSLRSQLIKELDYIIEESQRYFLIGLCVIGTEKESKEQLNLLLKQQYVTLLEQQAMNFRTEQLHTYLYGIQLLDYNRSYLVVYDAIFYTMTSIKYLIEADTSLDREVLKSLPVEEYIKEHYEEINEIRISLRKKVIKNTEMSCFICEDIKNKIKQEYNVSLLLRSFIMDCLINHENLERKPVLSLQGLEEYKKSPKEKVLIKLRLEETTKKAFTYVCKENGLQPGKVLEEYLLCTFEELSRIESNADYK